MLRSKGIYERQIDWLNQVNKKREKIKEEMFRAKTRSISPNLQRKRRNKSRVKSKSKSKSKPKKYIERYSMKMKYKKNKKSPKIKKVKFIFLTVLEEYKAQS